MVKEIDYTHEFWENKIGRGTLYEEFTVVTQERDVQQRRKVDGLVVLGERQRIAKRGEEPSRLDDQDLIVIQTKAERLGPYVFGQAILSPRLIRHSWRPRSLRSVLLCAADNPELGMPLANIYTMPWRSSTETRPAEEIGGSRPSAEVTPKVEVCIQPPTRRNCKRYGGWEKAVGVVQERIGGALIAPAVLPGKCEIDGVLIPAWNSSHSPTLDDVQDLDVVSIHGSEGAVGMYIAGEAIASKVLLEHLGASSVRSIIVCTKRDYAIQTALGSFPGIEVWPTTNLPISAFSITEPKVRSCH